MDKSRLIGILAFAVQILNAAAMVVQYVSPENAVYVAATTAAIQAFTGKVQSNK